MLVKFNATVEVNGKIILVLIQYWAPQFTELLFLRKGASAFMRSATTGRPESSEKNHDVRTLLGTHIMAGLPELPVTPADSRRWRLGTPFPPINPCALLTIYMASLRHLVSDCLQGSSDYFWLLSCEWLIAWFLILVFLPSPFSDSFSVFELCWISGLPSVWTLVARGLTLKPGLDYAISLVTLVGLFASMDWLSVDWPSLNRLLFTSSCSVSPAPWSWQTHWHRAEYVSGSCPFSYPQQTPNDQAFGSLGPQTPQSHNQETISHF